MRRFNVLLLMALLATGIATAREEEVDRSVRADPDGTVEIDNIAGTITVTGWGRDEVRVTGFLGDGTRELEFDGSGGRTRIRVVLEENEDVEGSELEIHVPLNSRILIDTVSAEVEVYEFNGELELETVSGDIDVEARPESAYVTTVSGDIDFVMEGALRDGRFKSVVGDIDVETGLDPDGRIRLDSVSGDIDLTLPGRVSATFDVSTFSGEIDSDLGGRVRRKGEYVPAKELKFSLGGGGARVTIETLSGDIDLFDER
jgi:hypothetical protein